MTDEELDQWRGREAWRLRHEYPEDATEVIAARFAREGRKPPEPVVDPDLLIAREAAAQQWEQHYGDKIEAQRRRDGWCDTGQAVTACRIAARMATDRERERAKVLVEYVRGYACPESEGADILAEYLGEAR